MRLLSTGTMKAKLRLSSYPRVLAIVVAAALSAACSMSNPFVVLNATDALLTVEYRFGVTDRPRETDHPRALPHRPVMKPADAVFDWDVDWQPGSVETTRVDVETASVTVQLPPRMALRVATTSNYSDSSWRWAVNIEQIKLTGSAGTIVLEGDQVRNHFIETDGIYLLTYR